MKKSRFSESQIVGILKESEGGIPVADILRTHGISQGTFVVSPVKPTFLKCCFLPVLDSL